MFRSITDTMKLLGHKSVDLFILQCGGCEWDLDYFGENIGQLSIAFHDATNVEVLDEFTNNNYVLFHRDSLEEQGGRVQALSFLKLRKGFFS